MSASRQRQLVLIGSLSLSGLLLGSFVSGFVVWRSMGRRMQDPEFLKRQLELLGPQETRRREEAPALVRAGIAQRKRITPQRPIIGRLVEVRKVTVASEVTGKIAEIPVEEGAPVVADKTVLARIDDVWCRFALVACRAQAASIKAKLAFEKQELERAEALLGKKGVSQTSSKRSRPPWPIWRPACAKPGPLSGKKPNASRGPPFWPRSTAP